MVHAIVTVFAVINPVICGTIFSGLTSDLTPTQRRWAAISVALAILIILIVSALIGLKVLSIFGISLDVFRLVGGMIVAYMGFDMLRGHQTIGQTSPTDEDAAAPNSLALLIMFAPGPGTITAIVTLAAVHTPDGLPVTAIIAAIVGAELRLPLCFSPSGLDRASVAARRPWSPFHGAHCGIHGDAVRADRVEGVL